MFVSCSLFYKACVKRKSTNMILTHFIWNPACFLSLVFKIHTVLKPQLSNFIWGVMNDTYIPPNLTVTNIFLLRYIKMPSNVRGAKTGVQQNDPGSCLSSSLLVSYSQWHLITNSTFVAISQMSTKFPPFPCLQFSAARGFKWQLTERA